MRWLQFFLFLLILIATPIHGGSDSRKLDETAVPGTSTPTNEKCTPCNPSPPPPSPSPPPPPTPSPPPPASPPPAPKKPPSGSYCPPPPSSYIYITGPPGPPGNLYPVVNDFNHGGRATTVPTVLIGCGFLVFLLTFGV